MEHNMHQNGRLHPKMKAQIDFPSPQSFHDHQALKTAIKCAEDKQKLKMKDVLLSFTKTKVSEKMVYILYLVVMW